MSNKAAAARMRRLGKIGWAGIVALALSGCTPGARISGDPKQVLNEYISKSFDVRAVSARADLLTYLTGEAKTRLAAWSDEQFQQAFMESKRQFIKLAVTEVKPINPKAVSVTYEITYLDHGKGTDAKVTDKKLAQMVMAPDDRWLISEVRNIKELVEYKNEMSLP